MRPDRHSDLEPKPPGATFADDAARWQAVKHRDRGADGAFVFAVRTTGVFCRPSCSSRAARRTNVEFFPAPPQAQAAGYRACKRCQPDTMQSGRRLLERACKLLTQDEESSSLSDVAAKLKLSPSALTRLFQRELGLSPREFLAQAKRERFRTALRNGEDIATATFGAGYGSSSRVYEGERAGLGMTPATYRKGGLGAAIDFTISPSPLRSAARKRSRLACAKNSRGLKPSSRWNSRVRDDGESFSFAATSDSEEESSSWVSNLQARSRSLRPDCIVSGWQRLQAR